jgi:hypothetical protein
MRDSKVIQAAAVAAILSAVAALAITMHGGFAPGITAGPHRAAGAALARQALLLLKPGGRILVITRDTTTFPNPAADLLLEGFRRELRQAHADISGVLSLQVDPLRRIEVPPGDFQNWIHHAGGGDVIVSFMGPPLLTAAQRRQLGEIKPAIVAFCPGGWPDQLDFRPLFANGLLRAAIVSRRDQPAVTGRPQNAQAWFDRNFTVVTAANVDDFVARPSASTAP